MSTTKELKIALKYTRGGHSALIFMIRANSFMQQGADLVSAGLIWYLPSFYGTFMQQGESLVSTGLA